MKTRFVAMLVLTLLHGAASSAAETGHPGVKNKRSALEQCRAGDTDSLAPAGRKQVAPDLSCAMRTSDLVPLLGKADLALVDVRPKQDFDAFHADRALNLTMEAVRTKTFLKSQQVLLVGNGKTDRALYVLCGELKAAGFQRVKVLRGGMLSWTIQRLPGIGTEPQASMLASLTPQELSLADRFDANIILVPNAGGGFATRLPKAVLLADGSPAEIRSAVERARKRSASGLVTAVMVTGTAYDMRQYDAIATSLGDTPLLIYPGSVAAYDQYLADQKAMWSAQGKGRKAACSF